MITNKQTRTPPQTQGSKLNSLGKWGWGRRGKEGGISQFYLSTLYQHANLFLFLSLSLSVAISCHPCPPPTQYMWKCGDTALMGPRAPFAASPPSLGRPPVRLFSSFSSPITPKLKDKRRKLRSEPQKT